MKPIRLKTRNKIIEAVSLSDGWVKAGACVARRMTVSLAAVLKAIEAEPSPLLEIYPGRIVFIPQSKSGVFYEARK